MKTVSKKIVTKKLTENKSILTDYEMNERIVNNIIQIIETNNVKEWKRGWRLPFKSGLGESLSSIYTDVVSGETAINIYSYRQFSWLDGNPIPAGFYVSFKDIKNHKLSLKKGSKGQPTYKFAMFEKHLTEEQKEAFNRELALDSDLNDSYNKLLSKEIRELPVKFTYYNKRSAANVEFYETLIYDFKNRVLKYKKAQYVLEYQFNINDLTEPVDVKKLWEIEDEKEEPTMNKRIKTAETIKMDYIKRTKLKFNEVKQNKAFYRPSEHSVTVPLISQFDNSNLYYATLFHEFAHSTGHKTLLNRKGIESIHTWGDSTYAKEELVAELSSLYTTQTLGIATDETFERTIAYLKSWGEGLKKGIKHNIINTVMYSQKASKLILNIK